MSRCLITGDETDDDYSARALRLLSPRLRQLNPFPYDQAGQLREAAVRASKLSIQGVQPKLSVSLSVEAASFQVVDRGGTFIVKPQNPLFRQLPENEALSMTLAKDFGLVVPLHGLVRCTDGSVSYFVKRFDRTSGGQKFALEDFAQLEGKDRETKYTSSLERVAAVVERHCSFPLVELARLYRLTVFSFLCGNEDQHLKNFSLLTKDGTTTLAPAYDLLNSTIALAAPQEESALPLSGKKRNLTRRLLVDYWGKERLHLPDKILAAVDNDIARSVPSWKQKVAQSFLADDLKQRYAELLDERVARLRS